MDSLRGQLPNDYIDMLGEIMSEDVTEEKQLCIDLWNKYSDKIQIGSYDHKGVAHYSPSKNKVYFNMEEDMREVMGENTTIFHEIAHLFDSQMGKDKDGWSIGRDGTSYKDDMFNKTIIKEVDDWTKREKKKLKDKIWRTPRIAEVREEIEWQFRDMPAKSKSDISDIVEGATKGKMSFGYGHGKAYWNRVKVSQEAFAEMYSATVNNPDSLEVLKEYLPKSYEVFIEVIKAGISK